MTFFKTVYHALIDSAPAHIAVAAMARALPPPHVALTHYEVVVPGLPPGLEGLRVLHVSDLHLRPGSELAWQLPEVAAAAPHDLAVYTGDFIDDDDGIAPVGTLLARMPRVAGAYAVLGNHDHRPRGRAHGRNDVGRLQTELAAAGLEVLTNTARPICGGELVLAGVDDPATGRDDLSRAMQGVSPGACCLLLAHSPDIVLRLGPYRPGLILAGHTHGGQIRLPLIGPLITMSKAPRRLTMGLHQYAGVPTFITRGIGYSGLNLRLSCPAEVALLTLRSSLAAERAA
jgi:predicted MPP superfamily phosphohydrolase